MYLTICYYSTPLYYTVLFHPRYLTWDDPIPVPKVKAREGFAIAWDMVANSARIASVESLWIVFGLGLVGV